MLLSDVLGWEISLGVLSPDEVGLELGLDSDMISMILLPSDPVALKSLCSCSSRAQWALADCSSVAQRNMTRMWDVDRW